MAKNITNTASNTLISGTSGNDFFENRGSRVTISAGKGNDSVLNDGAASVSIDAGAGDDSITCWWDNGQGGSFVTITGGAGNDTINSYGFNTTITGGKGDDYIFLGNSRNHLIQYTSGDGNDTIGCFDQTSTLSIAGGSFSTQVSGYDVIIKVGDEKITLKNVYASADSLHINNKTIKLKRKAIKLTSTYNDVQIFRDSVSVVGTSSADYIDNYGASVTINAGAGDDNIGNWSEDSHNTSINAGAGNDYIGNNAVDVTIDGGKGKDTIESGGSNVSINGGSGNDAIINHGSQVSIVGGKGNDFITLDIYSNSNLIQYAAGDGSDTIWGFKATDTLSISGGSYSTQTSGYDVLVKVGSETINLKNAYANADTLHINNKTVKLKRKTIKLTADNNQLDVVRDSVSVVGTSSNDYIVNGGSNVTINGGKGNDTIRNPSGDKVSIYGGAGADYLRGGSGQTTLWGGAGDDTLVGGDGKDIFVYKPGEGTDRIWNYQSGDMLQILKSNGKSGGSFTKSSFSDGTLSLTISGGGQVLFDYVSTSTNFNINGKSYKISGSKLKSN